MNLILFDCHQKNLLPFSYTRPIADFRCGILTLKEKWAKRLPEANLSYLCADYLTVKYKVEYKEDNFYLNATLLADDDLLETLRSLKKGDAIYDEKGILLMARSAEKWSYNQVLEMTNGATKYKKSYSCIENVWDIFVSNGDEIEKDFDLLTQGKKSATIDATNTLIGNRLFVEEGAKVQGAILNSNTGPIYIGKEAEVMEGSVVRGPLAVCEHGVLKLATKIYGATTIGPHSKVGGELNNAVIFGYSNKGHDGFLGNSVLGEWCNLGADTNVSNLKNNYANIKLWNYEKGGFKDSGRQFCGMMMGDHSKSGINTMFNTATVVGVSSNIYGGGFPRNFIPSFAWGGAEKWMTFKFEKAMEVAEKMMERRNIPLTDADISILKHVFEVSSAYRNF